MSGRITQAQLFNSMRFFINRNSRLLLNAQRIVATGRRINRISDDPIQGPRLLVIKSAKSKVVQFIRNIERADSVANIYDTTLGQAEELIVRVKELLLTEANEVSSTPETREAARVEIATILSQLVQISNTRFDGKYIYSGFAVNQAAFADATAAAVPGGGNAGTATVTGATVVDTSQVVYDDFQIVFTAPGVYDVVNTTSGATVVSGASYVSGDPIQFNGLEIRITDGASPPAAPQTGDTFDVTITAPGTYQGDGGQQRIEVQAGTTVQQNLTGESVFQGVGLPGGVDIFAIVNQVNDALRTNDRGSINALLDGLDTARQQIDSQRAIAGSRQNMIQNVLERQRDILLGLETVRSEIEDADLVEALTRLTQRQTAYEASLAAAGAISELSLLDFLR